MTGFPLLRLLLLVMCLGGLALPLSMLTGNRPPPPEAVVVESGDDGQVATLVTLRFAHLPEVVRLSSLGEVLWESDQVDEGLMEVEVELGLGDPAYGVELWLEVEWGDGVPETAVGVELEPDGLETRSQVAWGEGVVDEVLRFRWEEVGDE